MSTQVAVDQQHELRSGERTYSKNDQARHGEIQPGQQGHLPECHSPAAHAQDGGNDVDRGSDAAEAGDQQGQDPEVRAVSARKCLRSQGGVGEPSHVWSVACPIESVAADKTEIEEQSTESRHPEAKSVETRKRHISSANHQRYQIVCESKQDWHRYEENHRRPVHGEHSVENLRGDEIVMRTNELDAHDGRFNSSEHEKDQRIKDV